MTNPPGQLWHGKWTTLSGPFSVCLFPWVGFREYSQVALLGLRYASVIFGVGRSPSAPKGFKRPTYGRRHLDTGLSCSVTGYYLPLKDRKPLRDRLLATSVEASHHLRNSTSALTYVKAIRHLRAKSDGRGSLARGEVFCVTLRGLQGIPGILYPKS